MLLLAILVGRVISWATKAFNLGGGSAAPGLYALRIDPDLVAKLASKIPQNIIITGTNGKTTTARLLAHFAQAHGLKVIRNTTGSNLERGIASTLISHLSLYPKPYTLNPDLGIWELDEAAFNSVTPKLKSDLVVFLNVSRDQLDRYGEVDKIVRDWCQTLKTLPKATKLVLNADDPKIASLASCFSGKSTTFSLAQAADIKLNGLTGSTFRLLTTDYRPLTTLPLPGLYHIFDFLAAFTTGIQLRFNPQKMVDSLSDFTPAFGRVERFSLQPLRLQRKSDAYIFLIKNPAGATQVLQTIASELRPNDRLLIALNDNLADGTDVSWIWDAEFEKIAALPTVARNDVSVMISGNRAEELAVRLKYAGMEPGSLMVEKDLYQALQRAQKATSGRLFILPTYTALLQLQSILAKMGIKRDYWNEK